MSQESKKPKKRPAKQVKGDWPDDRIQKLIAAVKLRPGLYNIAIRAFGREKDEIWKEIAAELGNADDWLDCRAKWQGLRITFKVNLATLRRHPTGSNTIHWRFFEAMRFVDSSEDHKLTVPNSNLDANGADKVKAAKTQTFSTNSDPRRIWAVKEPPLARQALKNSKFKRMQDQALQFCTQRDGYSIFDEYIANELRGLPLDECWQLHRRINRSLVAEKEDAICTDPEDNTTYHSDIDACEIKLEDTETEEATGNESISPTPEANSVSTISSDLLSFAPDIPPASEWDLPSNFVDDSTKPTCPTTTTTQCNHSTDKKVDSTKRPYPFTVLEQSVTKLQKTIEQHKKDAVDDEFDLFGKSIALQLKRMPLERALICQENLQKVMNQERLLQR